MTQPQQNQQPPRPYAPPPPAPAHDRGDFDDNEWGIVGPESLTPAERQALAASQSGANRPGVPPHGAGGR